LRTLRFDVFPDVGAFTPLQLKPHFILSVCFNGSERWSREYGVPHQTAIRDLQTAFVLQVARVSYHDRYTYTDADRLSIAITRQSRRNGSQVEVRASFETPGGSMVAESSLCIVPLSLSDASGELAGLPAPMPPSYMSTFEPSERLEEPYPSPFPGMLNQIIESGELLSSYQYPLFINRHQCEFVDQWFFVEAGNLAAASREHMVFEQGARLPLLRRGLSLPVRELNLLYSRPFYLFDVGKVLTRAFRSHEGVVFVHELIKDDPSELHALVLERF